MGSESTHPIYLPDDLADELEEVAAAVGMESSELLDGILRKGLPVDEESRPALPPHVPPALFQPKPVVDGAAPAPAPATPSLRCRCCPGGCQHLFKWRKQLRCGCPPGLIART